MTNLKPGKTIGRYKIIRELGSGGFGVTYLANSEDLAIKVAIKEYFPEEFATRRGSAVKARNNEQKNFDWGKKRFLQEARTLAKFRNPNIVGVRQIFEENNTAYMVLDYESGRNLKAWRKEINDQPTEQELIEITRPILAALEVIHRNDLMHRDISPDNIIIRNDGSPVLIDFGSSRSMVQKTRTVSAMVKSGYSPPELYTSLTDSQGPWSDIYSYAATIHFLITGEVPEEATDRLIRDKLPRLAESVTSKYSAKFLNAMDAALSLKAEARPQSISDWEIMLGLADGQIASQPVREDEKISRPETSFAARNKRTNILGFGIAAALAVLFIGGYLVSAPKLGPPAISQNITPADPLPLPSEPEPPSLAGVTTVLLCSTALDTSRQAWDTSQSVANEVSEAWRRGLTVADCRAVLGVVDAPAAPAQPANKLADLSNGELCANALNVQRSDWDNSSIYQEKVTEVQRRGFTVSDCRKELGLDVADAPISGGYGAIIRSRDKGIFYGSWSYPTASEARESLVETCSQDTPSSQCEAVLEFINTCGAAATGPNGWGVAAETTRAKAEQQALTQCSQHSTNCLLNISFCSPPDEKGTANFVDYTKITSDQEVSANFVLYEGEDLWGGDRYVGDEVMRVQAESVGECSRSCNEDSQCDAFTYVSKNKVCYLKNFSTGWGEDRKSPYWKDGKIKLWGFPATSGVRTSQVSKTDRINIEYDTGIFYTGSIYSEPNIDPADHLQCAITCSNDNSCNAYNWIENRCQLIDTITGSEQNTKSLAGKKR